MSGNSHVGNPSLYEAGDQRNKSQAEAREELRTREHPPQSSRRGSSHAKEQREARSDMSPTEEELTKHDPLAPAKMHGHNPSRGAEVDAELRKEDEERLKQKGHK